MRKKISFEIPCYNEAGNVVELNKQITDIMKGLDYDYEILYTDNSSTDGTTDLLREMAAADDHVKVLLNNRNYGILDGRSSKNTDHYVSGDVVIGLAGDFQDPPELIPEFIKAWEDGYKVVCGRKTASEEGKVKYAFRDLFYRIIDSMSDVPQHHHISGIVLYDREVHEYFLQTDDDLYFRFALADMGYEVKYIDYVQNKRKYGKSSYSLNRYLTYAINSLCSVSYRPLRLMTLSGITLSFISFLVGMIYLIYKLIFWKRFQSGMAPVLIGMFFLGSLQLLFVGLLGEYIGAILRKVTKKPPVVLKEKINLDEPSDQEDG